MDIALQSHTEVARSKEVCEHCRTRCASPSSRCGALLLTVQQMWHRCVSCAKVPFRSTRPCSWTLQYTCRRLQRAQMEQARELTHHCPARPRRLAALARQTARTRKATPPATSCSNAWSASVRYAQLSIRALCCGAGLTAARLVPQVASNRFAQHLSGCLGLAGGARRGNARNAMSKAKCVQSARRDAHHSRISSRRLGSDGRSASPYVGSEAGFSEDESSPAKPKAKSKPKKGVRCDEAEV